jgi:hypothetical protein
VAFHQSFGWQNLEMCQGAEKKVQGQEMMKWKNEQGPTA